MLDGHPDASSSPPPSGLRIEVDESVALPRAVVRVFGEIDVATAPALEYRLEGLVGGGCRRLDLDLGAVPFCDVAGLNVLLKAQSLLSAHDGRLVVHGECRPLRIMVQALGLSRTLELAGTGRPAATAPGAPTHGRTPVRDPGLILGDPHVGGVHPAPSG